MKKEKPVVADIAYATIDFSKKEESDEPTATSKKKDSDQKHEDVLYAEVML